MAIEEATAKGGLVVAGYKIEAVIYDSGTATAGQYDPRRLRPLPRSLRPTRCVVANVGAK